MAKYDEKIDVLEHLDARFDRVDYKTFYRDIFPSGSFEKKGIYEQGKYNAIIVEITGRKKSDGRAVVHRHTVTDDLKKIDEVVARDNFSIMAPISYAGKARTAKNARELYALAIDLDGVFTEKNFNFLMTQLSRGHEMLAFVWGLPKPTYLVSSGTGIHLYYVFEKPIAMYPSILDDLERLKRRLTWQAWTQGSSSLHDTVQYEPICQGFRMVGTVTKKGNRTVAYRYGNGDKVTIDYLNQFIPKKYRINDLSYQSKLSLDKAKKLYPDWYENRIINKRPKRTWKCKRALYEWWINKVYDKGEQGHRYWCIMALASYAKKCGIGYEELLADSMALREFLDGKGDGTDPFTKDDVLKALEAYRDEYITYPIRIIEKRTGIPIERNRRNYRSQEQHLMGARALQEIADKLNGTNWREGNGRPKGSGTKKDIVIEWRKNNPNGRKIDCQRDTGLSRPTVLKWWQCH